MTESVTCPKCAGDGKETARFVSYGALDPRKDCSRCDGKGHIESDCYDWADDQIEEWVATLYKAYWKQVDAAVDIAHNSPSNTLELLQRFDAASKCELLAAQLDSMQGMASNDDRRALALILLEESEK